MGRNGGVPGERSGGGGALILTCAVVPTRAENTGMKYLTCIFLTYIVV